MELVTGESTLFGMFTTLAGVCPGCLTSTHISTIVGDNTFGTTHNYVHCLTVEDGVLRTKNQRLLQQTGVLCFGCFINGNLGIGMFPECEEIAIRTQRSEASGRIGRPRSFRLQCIRSRHAQMRQSASPAVPDDAVVIEDLLELGGG